MIRPTEITNYLNNKKEIFLQLIDAIELAHSTRKKKIYLKGISILEEEIDVVAQKEEWLMILDKALIFFENAENYEMCQRCKLIKDSIITKKKSSIHGENFKKKKNATT